MAPTSRVVACLCALVIVGAARASAQIAPAQRIGPLLIDRGFVGSMVESPSGVPDQRPTGPRYVPHRHWSWLFPNGPVPPFASDPLMRHHWWLDPLLRRHWWR